MHVKCIDCEHQVGRYHLGRCPACRGIVAAEYSEAELETLKTAEIGRGLDRYRAVFPTSHRLPNLGEGDTPLVKSKSIAPALGLKQLYFKLEGCNPSGAFKDRPAALGAALAQEAQAGGILTASSGNAGSALAAYAAAVDLPCVVLFEPGNPAGKARQMAAHGASVIPVEGVFQHHPDQIAKFIMELAEDLGYYLAFVWASVNPLLLEAIKSISYEVVAALGRPPDMLVTPVGGGDLLTGQWRGYKEFLAVGRAAATPRVMAVQSTAAPPLLRAFERGAERVPVLVDARSGVSGINVAFSGDHALAAVRESAGAAVGVTDEAIYAAQARLAKEEGLWVEPAAAAPVAAVQNLAADGQLDPEEQIVCLLSGAGFKDALLAADEAQALVNRTPVPFDSKEVGAAIQEAARS